MLFYDRQNQRLINLENISHINCLERTDPKSNVTSYYIQFKMNYMIYNEYSDCQEQFVLTSTFGNQESRDTAFSNLIGHLEEEKKLFILR